MFNFLLVLILFLDVFSKHGGVVPYMKAEDLKDRHQNLI